MHKNPPNTYVKRSTRLSSSKRDNMMNVVEINTTMCVTIFRKIFGSNELYKNIKDKKMA